MPIIDAHCDVLSKLLLDPGIDFNDPDCGMDITLDRLVRADVALQLFAIWLPDKVRNPGFEHLRAAAELFQTRIVERAGLAAIRTSQQLEEAFAAGKRCAMLTLEGADALNGDLDHVRKLFELGVRCLGLTWNYANWAADGVMEPRNGSLTLKGRTLVKECNRLGMITDVSHLSEKSFWELADLSDRPFIASHSNALELCGHPRNLNRKQVECIASKGGVIGINFYPPFLSSSEKPTIDHVIRHIETICEWGGERSVGLGSDFDGIGTKVDGLETPEGYARLADALGRRFTEEQVKNILFLNWYDFFVTQLPKSECSTFD